MIVTDPEKEVTLEIMAQKEYEDDSDNEPEGSFYVERGTDLIYEVRFFPEFALVRPAHPDYLSSLERLDFVSFTSRFEEYNGDIQAVRDFLWGAALPFFVVTKKDD